MSLIPKVLDPFASLLSLGSSTLAPEQEVYLYMSFCAPLLQRLETPQGRLENVLNKHASFY